MRPTNLFRFQWLGSFLVSNINTMEIFKQNIFTMIIENTKNVEKNKLHLLFLFSKVK